MKKNHFISGSNNITCDVCSKKIKAHEAHQRWDGLIVCQRDYEVRHPQDFVKARTDQITVPFQRPRHMPEYYICTLENSVGIVGLGVAGCMIAGKLSAWEK